MKNVELRMKKSFNQSQQSLGQPIALHSLPSPQNIYFSIYSWLLQKLDTNFKILPYEDGW